eukprot:6173371-Pleurochrysis_carterae.AAC.1
MHTHTSRRHANVRFSMHAHTFMNRHTDGLGRAFDAHAHYSTRRHAHTHPHVKAQAPHTLSTLEGEQALHREAHRNGEAHEDGEAHRVGEAHICGEAHRDGEAHTFSFQQAPASTLLRSSPTAESGLEWVFI